MKKTKIIVLVLLSVFAITSSTAQIITDKQFYDDNGNPIGSITMAYTISGMELYPVNSNSSKWICGDGITCHSQAYGFFMGGGDYNAHFSEPFQFVPEIEGVTDNGYDDYTSISDETASYNHQPNQSPESNTFWDGSDHSGTPTIYEGWVLDNIGSPGIRGFDFRQMFDNDEYYWLTVKDAYKNNYHTNLKNRGYYFSGRYIRNTPHWFSGDWESWWATEMPVPMDGNSTLKNWSVFESYTKIKVNNCTVPACTNAMVLAADEINITGSLKVERGAYFSAIHGTAYAGEASIIKSQISENDIPNSLTNLEVFPNPSNGFISISYPAEKVSKLKIINLEGKTVYTNELENDLSEINVSHLNKGVYYLQLSNDIETKTEKLILN